MVVAARDASTVVPVVVFRPAAGDQLTFVREAGTLSSTDSPAQIKLSVRATSSTVRNWMLQIWCAFSSDQVLAVNP